MLRVVAPSRKVGLALMCGMVAGNLMMFVVMSPRSSLRESLYQDHSVAKVNVQKPLRLSAKQSSINKEAPIRSNANLLDEGIKKNNTTRDFIECAPTDACVGGSKCIESVTSGLTRVAYPRSCLWCSCVPMNWFFDALPAVSCTSTPTRPSWILYNRIGKAGSTTTSKHLFMHGYNSSYHELVRAESGVVKNHGECYNPIACKNVENELRHTLVDASHIASSTTNGCADRILQNSRSPCVKQRHLHRTAISAFHAHWVNFTDVLPEEERPVYIQVLRDPVERYMSQYAWHINLNVSSHQPSLHICATEGGEGCPPTNYQTRYFCGNHEECTFPPSNATFIRAVSNMLNEYWVVGTIEHFDEFWKQLSHRLPFNFQSSDKPGSNLGRHNSNRDEKPASLIDIKACQDANAYDVALYDLALKLIDTRSKSCTNDLS